MNKLNKQQWEIATGVFALLAFTQALAFAIFGAGRFGAMLPVTAIVCWLIYGCTHWLLIEITTR